MKHVAVLMGGTSSERPGSLRMGKAVAEALAEAGYRVSEIDAGPGIVDDLRQAAPDVVFNALMGKGGEDGLVQGLLEWMELPYTHSGVVASSIGLDKELSRQVFAAAGLPVAQGRLISRNALGEGHPLPPPYVLKPNAEGGSIGVFLVEEGDPVPEPDGLAESLLAEAYIPGRDLTVGVLRDRALMVSEIIPPGKLWDHDAKWGAEGVRHGVPAELPEEIAAACLRMAEEAHRVLRCRFVSRADFRWDESRGLAGLVLLEVNTQPGVGHANATFRRQLTKSGIAFPDFCSWVVEDASLDR